MRVPPRRVLVVAAVCLLAIIAVPGTAVVRLAAAAMLVAAGVGYLLWLRARGEWGGLQRPAAGPDERLADIAAARVGEPVAALCRFILRLQQTPVERWQGEERLWMVVTSQWLWLLHQTPAGGIGGVKSRFSRGGLHARWTDHRLHAHHVAELSWPENAWFLVGELHGTRPQRLRLMGLLAGDELGVRELVTRPDADQR